MTIVWEDDATQLDAPHMNLLEQVARKGVANGYAALGADGLVPLAQLPPPPVIADADIPATITRDTELAAGLVGKVDKVSYLADAAPLLEVRPTPAENPKLQIIGSGSLQWGPGGATNLDTTLYRSGPALLNSDGTIAARRIWATFNGPTGGIAFGGGGNETIYRQAAGILRTDGTLDANAITINGVPVGGAVDLTVKVDKDSVVVSGARIVANKLLAADAQPAFRITGGGTISWGSGGATAPDTVLGRGIAGGLSLSKGPLFLRDASGPNNRIFFGANDDTNLYRAAANQLKTDGDFSAASVALANPDATLYRGAAGRIDTNASLAILYGNVQFGSPPDTTLYRSAAAVLKTDGELQAGSFVRGGVGTTGVVTLGSTGGQATIYFGNALDAALYRISASNLGTDSSLWVNNSLIVDNANGGGRLYFGSALDTTLWRLAAGQVQTDGYFIAKADIVARDGLASKVRIGDLIGNGAPGIAFGAAGGDVNLARATLAAAGRGLGLKVGGHLGAGADIVARDGGSDQVVVGNHNGVAGIEFGSAADTTLYRSAAGMLAASFGALGARDIVYGAADSGGAGFRMVRVAN